MKATKRSNRMRRVAAAAAAAVRGVEMASGRLPPKAAAHARHVLRDLVRHDADLEHPERLERLHRIQLTKTMARKR